MKILMSAKFKTGDVVMVISGGPRMTISELGVSEPYYHECTWFDKNQNPQREDFPETSLKKVDVSKPSIMGV